MSSLTWPQAMLLQHGQRTILPAFFDVFRNRPDAVSLAGHGVNRAAPGLDEPLAISGWFREVLRSRPMLQASPAVLDLAGRAQEAAVERSEGIAASASSQLPSQVLRVGAWSVRKLPENPEIPLAGLLSTDLQTLAVFRMRGLPQRRRGTCRGMKRTTAAHAVTYPILGGGAATGSPRRASDRCGRADLGSDRRFRG